MVEYQQNQSLAPNKVDEWSFWAAKSHRPPPFSPAMLPVVQPGGASAAPVVPRHAWQATLIVPGHVQEEALLVVLKLGHVIAELGEVVAYADLEVLAHAAVHAQQPALAHAAIAHLQPAVLGQPLP